MTPIAPRGEAAAGRVAAHGGADRGGGGELIKRPLGTNLSIINSMTREIPMERSYACVAPFVASDLIRVMIIVLFPGITFWLVGVLFG
jgi:hypothetical protein